MENHHSHQKQTGRQSLKFMNDIHEKLDRIFEQIEAELPINPDKAKDLLMHVIDLCKVEFNKLTK